jgi:hypothetical protein
LPPKNTGIEELITHAGGCHCRRVRFEVDAPASLQVVECDCSICKMSGFLHLIVPNGRFRLLQGREALTTYRFNTHTARHMFCSSCGVKSFYIPRSDPGGVSVNPRCLDPGTVESLAIAPFKGSEWERDIGRLRGC